MGLSHGYLRFAWANPPFNESLICFAFAFSVLGEAEGPTVCKTSTNLTEMAEEKVLT